MLDHLAHMLYLTNHQPEHSFLHEVLWFHHMMNICLFFSEVCLVFDHITQLLCLLNDQSQMFFLHWVLLYYVLMGYLHYPPHTADSLICFYLTMIHCLFHLHLLMFNCLFRSPTCLVFDHLLYLLSLLKN